VLINRAMLSAVAKQPPLWPTAIAAYRSMIPRRWWRRRPFLPVPDGAWMRFRLETAYGGDGTPGPTAGEELTTWLRWLRHSSSVQP
jgi:hypothetical protein